MPLSDFAGIVGSTGSHVYVASEAPTEGSGLDPLDGINNPWRYSIYAAAWVGPAYSVSWDAGAEIPSPPGELGAVGIYMGVGTTFVDVVASGHAGAGFDISPTSTGEFPDTIATAAAGGSAVMYLNEIDAAGYPEVTAPVDPDLDLLDLLGPDITVDGPYAWVENEGVGIDGDVYVHREAVNSLVVYGPKDGGVWGDRLNLGSAVVNTTDGTEPRPLVPTSVIWCGIGEDAPDNAQEDDVFIRHADSGVAGGVFSYDGTDLVSLTDVLTSPDGTRYRLVVSDVGVLSTVAV